ncbi:collagen-like triple helix repeat-containing protein [Spirosoma luteum]|uniref:collagen-like triple helix repeat-containing protein n=1 Tax=Spirosoma luteum TaxID=431553 RepID=UPI000379FECA|nr:collagen-like protein [Spirosoma luteum]
MFHTKIAQIIRPLLLALTIMSFFAACKPGDPGPAGETGPAGPAGATGPAGPAGSANVTQITYGSRTHTGSSIDYTMSGVSAAMASQAAIFVYLSNSAASWYPIPGIFNGTNEYRNYIIPAASSTVRVIRVSGGPGGTDTFAATRIVLIPASAVVTGRKGAIDYTDYEAVKKAYNLPD